MAIRINGINAELNESTEEIKARALKKISASESNCTKFKILRRSVDARKKHVSFVYSVQLCLNDEKKVACNGSSIIKITEKKPEKAVFGTESLSGAPVVIGTGPCGLFCALTLAENGYHPIVLERGDSVENRTKHVNTFFGGGDFNPRSNIQFGEGGAGTFSDGKLTTRINDPLSDDVLRLFVKFGADPSILINAKPHIGTDVLKKVVKNIRNEITSLGGTVRFNSLVNGLLVKNGKIYGVKLDTGEEILSDAVVFAIGHSARDTYKLLLDTGVKMEQKAFSVGVRIEHSQDFINNAMYGDFANHPQLGAASYSLSYRKGNRGCYSFCMCPGGSVVAAASEEGGVVTNGMSEFSRNGKNSNAAICVSVSEKDFNSAHPLAGIKFQRQLEQAAYSAGGGNYIAPVQTASNFLAGKKTKSFDSVLPTYPNGTFFYDLNKLFPKFICSMLADGLRFFDGKIKGFTQNGAILTAPETRTSSPVRILRTDAGESINVSGLYPAGEGAGYAGGIMSAAVDGIKTANKIAERFSPFDN